MNGILLECVQQEVIQLLYDGVFVPDELLVYKTDDHIKDFLIDGANWSFGGLTCNVSWNRIWNTRFYNGTIEIT